MNPLNFPSHAYIVVGTSLANEAKQGQVGMEINNQNVHVRMAILIVKAKNIGVATN